MVLSFYIYVETVGNGVWECDGLEIIYSSVYTQHIVSEMKAAEIFAICYCDAFYEIFY